MPKVKHRLTPKISSNEESASGFTLLELIIVIVILGVMSVGIASFISLSTKTYMNVTERDNVLANARFVVERLNREIRDAVPNSIRIANNTSTQCIEFVPIAASTTYLDIPVTPEPAKANFTAIRFNNSQGDPYECVACSDQVIVYPVSTVDPSDVYDNHNDLTGKVFNVGNFSPTASDEWTIPINNGAVIFEEDSPTERLYIANKQVSYCVTNGQINRHAKSIGGSQTLPPDNSPIKMAEYLAPIDVNNLPFIILPATLTRNAIVQVNLHFTRDGEDYVFNNDIHINNIP